MRSLVEALSRQTLAEGRAAGMVRYGTVTHVDAKEGKVRLRLGGTDEEPFLSPWVRYSQQMGALKVHTPPSVGQQFALLAQAGDAAQSFAVPLSQSDQNASPSEAGDENVATFGPWKLTLRGNELSAVAGSTMIKAIPDGKVSIESSGEIGVKGSKIVLDGPVEMPKGFTAGDGTDGAISRVRGGLHAERKIESDTEVVAPVLRGTVIG